MFSLVFSLNSDLVSLSWQVGGNVYITVSLKLIQLMEYKIYILINISYKITLSQTKVMKNTKLD